MPYVASYMRNHGSPEVTSEHTTWITATYLMGQGVFIIVGSYIEQNYDSRIACIFGCVIHTVSTFLTMWAIDYNFTAVILVYGLGSGLGCGSAYMSSIIAAQKWFPTRKGIFTGVIVAGFGFGGLIFTNLQTLYLNPDNRQPRNGYFDEQVYSKVPDLFMYMGIIFTIVQTIGCLLAFPAPSSEFGQREGPSGSPGPGWQSNVIINEEPLPDMRAGIWSSLKYRIFYIIGLMMMLVAPGVTFVNSLGKRYGQSYIEDDKYLAQVVAFSAVANALGRLTWGFLADRFAFSTCFSIKVALFATLIIFFPFSFVLKSNVLYLIWMLGLFFGFSGTFVLFPVLIEQVFGSKYHGMIYGILYLFLALSSIISSYLIQVTVGPSLASDTNPDEKFYVRLGPCVIIAIAYVISVAIYYLALPVRRLNNAIKRRKDIEMSRAKNTLFNRQDLHPGFDRGLDPDKSGQGKLDKENSLGSIVRFGEVPNREADNRNRVQTF